MGSSLADLVDAAWRDRSAAEILAAPPSALKGVSEKDADLLDQALGIQTVLELAENRHVAGARAVAAAGGRPAFDPGPPAEWEDVFAVAPLGEYEDHPGRFRLDFGPVYYRGRLDGTARLLVVGQDPSTDELLAQRAFVGQSGQRLQRLLEKAGLSSSYLMLNVFLFGVFGQFDNELRTISLEPAIRDYRNALFDRAANGPLEAVLTVGSAARHAVDHWPAAGGLPVIEVVHPAAPDAMVLQSWNDRLPDLIAAVSPDRGEAPDPTPYAATFQPTDSTPIPRRDLPFGLPPWHGTEGTRSHRNGNTRIEWEAVP